MAKKSVFRSSMIANATKAAAAMQSSTIAKQLKANGFTAATMSKAASNLTALHDQMETAHNAWLQASAALSAAAQEFEATWSSYCNIVRGITPSAGVRKAHGVPSPGVRKGPQFRRGPRNKATPAVTAQAAPATKPQ